MSNRVSYNGKDLGGIRPEVSVNKWVFVANDLASLETLLKLSPTDIIDFEGPGKMPYSEFKERHLSDIDVFYPSTEAWACRFSKGSTKKLVESS